MKLLKTGAVLCVTLAGCYKILQLPQQDTKKVHSMLFKEGKPVIFAHRAGQFEAPENTIIAINTAYKNGALAVEVDLDFTKDGTPILFHDDSVDRTTNGTGLVKDIDYATLQKLNAAHHHPYIIVDNQKIEHSFESVPTLYEAVKLCIDKGITMDLDIKSNPKLVSTALKELIQKYPKAHEHIFLTSFYPHYLYLLRKEFPDFAAGVIWRPLYLSRTIAGEPRYSSATKMFLMSMLDSFLSYFIHSLSANFLGISMAVMKKDTLSEYYLKCWNDQNVELIVWTVNNIVEKEYFLNHLKTPIITDSVLNRQDCKEQTT